MNRILPFFALIVAGILFTSCDESQKGRTLPRHSGEPGEVLLVMDETEWLGPAGDSLRAVMEAYYPQLPQAEPSFSLLQFSPAEMSDLLRHHRNIIRITIGLEAEGRNKVTLTRDQWSNNQLVFNAYAEDTQAWFELLRDEFDKVVSIINKTEIDRIQAKYRENGNDELEKKLAKKFGIQLFLPYDCKMAKEAEDFIWLKRERIKYLGNTAHDITQGFFVYTYPYTSDSALTQSRILAVRDSVLKKYVPGPAEGTYMTTEYEYPPTSEIISLNEQYAVLTRGLWKTENYFMGGPFVSITTTYPSGDRIICVSGYVFAPRFQKREYIRDVEAIIRSLTFI